MDTDKELIDTDKGKGYENDVADRVSDGDVFGPGCWDRLRGEPTLWYERFTIYRLLGPGRTIEAAYRSERVAMGRDGSRQTRPGYAWTRNAKSWHWLQRASAWDDAERNRLCAEEANRRIELEFMAWSKLIGLAEKLRTMSQACDVDGEAFGRFINNPAIEHEVQLDIDLIEAAK